MGWLRRRREHKINKEILNAARVVSVELNRIARSLRMTADEMHDHGQWVSSSRLRNYADDARVWSRFLRDRATPEDNSRRAVAAAARWVLKTTTDMRVSADDLALKMAALNAEDVVEFPDWGRRLTDAAAHLREL